MTEKPREAPTTLSGVARLVVECGRKLDREKYFPNHGVWHRPITHEDRHYFPNIPEGNVCLACDAGAIMSVEIGFLSEDSYPFGGQSADWEHVYQAADLIRENCFAVAMAALNKYVLEIDDDLKAKLERIDSVEYTEFVGWEEFDRHLDSLEGIAAQFEQLGL